MAPAPEVEELVLLLGLVISKLRLQDSSWSAAWVARLPQGISSSEATLEQLANPLCVGSLDSCVCMALRRRCAAGPRNSEVVFTDMFGPYLMAS